MKNLKIAILFFLFIPAIMMAQTQKIDQAAMDRIRKEWLENSKITVRVSLSNPVLFYTSFDKLTLTVFAIETIRIFSKL